MAKMSKTQRTVILDFHNGVNAKGNTMLALPSTIAVLVREGWATFGPGVKVSAMLRAKVRAVHVTRAGLIAAGVDMDAIHAEALTEDAERYQGVTVEAAPHGGWHVFLPSGICVAWRTNSEHAQALAKARTHAEALR